VTTYFDRPLLKAPHWGWNVVTYLFLGGIMGGLGVIAAVADPRDASERKMRSAARVTSLALAAVNPAILVSHLGRPERFLNMLRIVKYKSPMSLGVWGLLAYSAVAGATVTRDLAESGRFPRWMRHLVPDAFTALHALLGSFVAGYSGVLLSATAIPLWGAGKRHIPAASVCSGMSSACALMTLISTLQGNHGVVRKLERLEMFSSVAEAGVLMHFRRHAGELGAPMFEGARGKRLRDLTLVGGIAVPFALNLAGQLVRFPKPIDAGRSIVSSLLVLIGGYNYRETLIEAGKGSANDPRAAFRQPE
jgi:formate-dependent nitrite reductase membrane component NrfD